MAQVIASGFARTPEQTIALARRAAMAGADWIELRLDHWPAGTPLEPTLAEVALPVLAACRLPRDGGEFPGSAAERRTLLAAAQAAGAQGIDLEGWDLEPWPSRPRLWVRSLHALERTPSDLAGERAALLADRGAVAKIVVPVADAADAAPLLGLLAATDQRHEPTVAFATGPRGTASRILAAVLGAPFLYASADSGEPTAAGQCPVDLVVELYRAHALGTATRVFGLLGLPALGSLGPWLHNRVFRALGLDAVFLALETVRPGEVLAMLPLRRRGGFSVTIPHKDRARALCHRVDADAAACEAVNTLTFAAGDQIVGANTDVVGVREALSEAGVPERGPAAVLGLGGAARAAAVALARRGHSPVTLLGRSPERAAAFAAPRGFALAPLTEAALTGQVPAVVVHATPVGSEGSSSAGERLLPGWTPPPSCAVLDMVYRPERTPLLRDVARAGALAIPGRRMFLHQARAQLLAFTGTLPSLDALERALP